jgi:ubiquinone/menaquinone biosynthesis C-methylase UbiE
MSLLIETAYCPEEAQREEARQAIQTAYREALSFLSRHTLNYPDGFEGIRAGELRDIALAILGCSSILEVYDLLAQTTKKGISFYDAVVLPQHRDGHLALRSALHDSRCEQQRVANGLDIGAGTGESTIILAQEVCNHVTAIDSSHSILQVARRKLSKAAKGENWSFDVQVMDALNLTLPDESFDIVITHALNFYLSYDEWVAFMSSVHRILKVGGRYYQCYIERPWDLPSIYDTSPRARLASRIIAAILLFTYSAEHLARYKADPTSQLLDPEGFVMENYTINHMPYPTWVTRLVKI